mgnify:CR=1 FL=1|jgi:hypothetical protein
MRQKEGFVLRDICGDKAIVPEGFQVVDFRKMISMNDTAVWLWEKCTELGDFTAEQLAEALCGEYEVESTRALADINRILDQWKEMGLVE